jgi:hypothetical protein
MKPASLGVIEGASFEGTKFRVSAKNENVKLNPERVVMQFGEWHGRPAREITRKMRVPHSNCITTPERPNPER